MTVATGRSRSQRRNPRLSSAGQILGISLLCFAIWLFLDARQLYQSAQTSPLGVRRSVAVAITRPIARVEDFLGVDRLDNAVNRVIGKTGTPGGSAVAPAITPLTTPPTTLRGGHPKPTQKKSPPPSQTLGPVRIAQPSRAHELTVLDIGDSIGEDLGAGLSDELGNVTDVKLVNESVGDTGLANLGYYNWLAELPAQLAKYHPQAVVVMLGGNDGQAFQSGNTVVGFGTPIWHRIYQARVAQLMAEATDVGARVIWVGLPVVGPTADLSNSDIEAQNAVYAAAAAKNPAVTYVSSWKLFENSAGQYSTYLSIPGQGLVQVRDADEVHIDPPGGTDLIGSYVVEQMERAWHIKL
jgi:lysophospholipase L1-like esterase